jgi:hypothetical protein
MLAWLAGFLCGFGVGMFVTARLLPQEGRTHE